MLIESAYVLIQGKSPAIMGIEILATGLIVGAVMLTNGMTVLRKAEKKYRQRYLSNIFFNHLPILLLVTAAVLGAVGRTVFARRRQPVE